MPMEYVWESTRTSHEVLEIILDLTKDRGLPFACRHKLLGNGDLKFRYSFWDRSIFIKFPCYEPPTLKGVIQDSQNGCRVTAEKRVISSVIFNVLSVLLIIAYYLMGIAALVAGFELAIVAAAIAFLLAISGTWWFLRGYRKYSNMETQLEILNTATESNYRVVATGDMT